MDAPTARGRRGPRRILLRIGLAVAGLLALLVLLALLFKPWYSIPVIRWVFDRAAAQADLALAEHLAGTSASRLGLAYGPDAQHVLDVHLPAAAPPGTCAVVWIHGGGFVSGAPGYIGNYARLLAERGHPTVVVGYGLAPRVRYPQPMRDVLAALAWLAARRDELGLAGRPLVLAGDSAGALLAGQVAAALTTPGYAAQAGVDIPSGVPELAGLVLYCGPYQPSARADGPFGTFMERVITAHLGDGWRPGDPLPAPLDLPRQITPRFPPTFLSCGNGDPLLPQTIALRDALRRHGVPTSELLHPQDLVPALGHEYQFDFGRSEARAAFAASLRFLAELKPTP